MKFTTLIIHRLGWVLNDSKQSYMDTGYHEIHLPTSETHLHTVVYYRVACIWILVVYPIKALWTIWPVLPGFSQDFYYNTPLIKSFIILLQSDPFFTRIFPWFSYRSISFTYMVYYSNMTPLNTLLQSRISSIEMYVFPWFFSMIFS